MKKIIALLTALTTAAYAAVAVSADTNKSDDFLSQISSLVSATMDDEFIGSLNLTIGCDTMNLDGEKLKIDNEGSVPIIENDSTLLPIRGVAEAIGAEVEYYEPTQTVSICSAYTEVNLQIGSTSMEINGEVHKIPTAAKIENDRALIPLRAAAEALGCEVVWNEDAQKITLTRPYQSKRIIVYSKDADTTDAVAVISDDDMTVLQFETEEAAKRSVEINQSKGFVAEPDYICSEVSLSWGTDRMNASAYYNENKQNHTDVVVAIVDSGLDSTNSCFDDKIIQGFDVYNNDSTTEDRTGHGTHVSSTVADVTAGFKKVKIMPVKVFGSSGKTSALIVCEGIKYAVNAGADVINLSLGGAGKSTAYDKAMELAKNKDVTVVAAAGNENIDLTTNYYHPACNPGVVTVSAVDSSDNKAQFSNYGQGIIDFAAPGVNITGAAIGGGTIVKNGTSMAAPHIAGAIALLRSVNPGMSSDEAVSKLKSCADNIGSSEYYGAGIVNMEKLITKTPVKNEIYVTTLDATDIDYTNAVVSGKVLYEGTVPSEVGIYFGLSADKLSKVGSDNITHNKNPFDMWYDLNKEAKQLLQQGTTYYYQCYAVQSGIEKKGEIKSFTTQGRAAITVKTTEAKYVTDKNAVIYGEAEYSDVKPDEVGIYFGASMDNMSKIAKDTSITHNKNPFEMWYDLNNDANMVLLPKTEYYWQCYAIADGVEIKGDVKSFVTQSTSVNGIYITTGEAGEITSENAVLYGSAVYSEFKPGEVGLYFGYSPDRMVKVAKDNITHNKNPFDIWYDLNEEAKLYLKKGTTYYYRLYATRNGVEIFGETKSFTTK